MAVKNMAASVLVRLKNPAENGRNKQNEGFL